jgi:hypothetical protein
VVINQKRRVTPPRPHFVVILKERSLRLKDLLYFVCHPEGAFFASEGPAV